MNRREVFIFLILSVFVIVFNVKGEERISPEWPVSPIITGTLGEFHNNYLHGGNDLGGEDGFTVVRSADSGIIHAKRNDLRINGPGNHYEIVHSDGLVTRYLHLNKAGFQLPTPIPTPSQSPVILVWTAGTPVPQGHPLAFVGNTGTTAVHLHFELRDTVTFTPTWTATATPTLSPTRTPTDTVPPDSPTYTPYPTDTPTTIPTSTPTPTPVNGPPITTDFLNAFQYLAPPSTLSSMPQFEQTLIIPEYGAKLEPYLMSDPLVGYAPNLPECLLLNMSTAQPLHVTLAGECMFAVNCYDRISPGTEKSKLGLYWLGYKESENSEWNYQIEFDKVLYAERYRQGDIFRIADYYSSQMGGLGGTRYWYKLYYDQTPTPLPNNVKEQINYGVFDGTQHNTGDQVTLVIEGRGYPFIGSPTPIPQRREIIIHIVNPTYWVDCYYGDDENPGTFEYPFETISFALSIATAGDHVVVKPGLCSQASGETFPLAIPDGVHLEGAGCYGTGGTVIDASPPPSAHAVTMTYCSSETVVEHFVIVGAGISGIHLDHASPVIRHNQVRANGGAGIWCANSSSPVIINNLIILNGGDGIYIQGMTGGDDAVLIISNTIHGNSADGIYSADFSNINVIDSIITNNGEWGIYAEMSSSQAIWFDNIYNNTSGDMNYSPSPGTGVISSDPRYAVGYYGSYYLAQDNRQLSPCVDAGSTVAAEHYLQNRITSISGDLDLDRIDIGFHHKIAPASPSPTYTVTPAETPTPEPTVTGSVPPWPTETPYFSPTPIPSPQFPGEANEGFEHDCEGWSWNGLWHLVSNDPEDEFYTEYAQVDEGSRAMWYGSNNTGDYETGAANAGSLVSPSILVAEPYVISFQSWEATEGTGLGFDTRKVYISLDDGETWQLLFSSSNNDGAWHQVVIDLQQFAGLVIRLKFEFDTVDDNFNDFQGWFIDDMHVIRPIPSLSNFGIVGIIIIMGLLITCCVGSSRRKNQFYGLNRKILKKKAF